VSAADLDAALRHYAWLAEACTSHGPGRTPEAWDAAASRLEAGADAADLTGDRRRFVTDRAADARANARILRLRARATPALLLALAALAACDLGVEDGAASHHIQAADAGWTSRTLHIGAAAFVGDSGFGVMSQAGYLYPDAAMIAYAPIPVPADVLLASVTVFYVVGGGAVRPAVRRMNPATGSITPVWSGAYDSDGTAIESQSAALGVAALASDVYWIEVLLTGAANRLYGAAVEYVEPGGAW
jgi:hypothetical protein